MPSNTLAELIAFDMEVTVSCPKCNRNHMLVDLVALQETHGPDRTLSSFTPKCKTKDCNGIGQYTISPRRAPFTIKNRN